MHIRMHLREHLAVPLYRNGYFLMLNSVLGALVGVLFWMLVARRLDAPDVGRAAALVSATTLAALVGKLGLDAALVRRAPGLDAGGKRALLGLAVGAASVFATVAALGSLLIASRLRPDLALAGDAAHVALFVLGAIVLAVAWMLDAFFVAERRAGRSFARNLVFNAARLLLPLPFLALVAGDVAVLAAWVVAAAASVAAALALTRPLLAGADGGYRVPPRLVARDALANYPMNVGEFLPHLALPLVVVAMLGAEANARFFVAWTLVGLGLFASKSISNSAFAEMVASGSTFEGRESVLRHAARQHLLVLAPFMLGVVALGPSFLHVYGTGYAEGSLALLIPLTVALPFAAVANLAITLLRAGEHRAALAAFPLAQNALGLGGAALGFATGGLAGGALGWLAANVLVALPALALVLSAWRDDDPHALGLPHLRGRPHQE